MFRMRYPLATLCVMAAVVGLMTALFAENAPDVARLSDADLITTESTLRGAWQFERRLHIATLPVYTSKHLALSQHQLANQRVSGAALTAQDQQAALSQIRKDLRLVLGDAFLTEEALSWLEIVRAQPGSYLSSSVPNSAALTEALARLAPETLYFWPLKLDGKYRLQIKGQPGEFISIFIGCDTKPDDPMALASRVAPFLLGQSYSQTNVEQRDFTVLCANDAVRVICGERAYDMHWEASTPGGNDTLVLDPRRFFGIRIDVDLKRM
jgi:hypothetical protein